MDAQIVVGDWIIRCGNENDMSYTDEPVKLVEATESHLVIWWPWKHWMESVHTYRGQSVPLNECLEIVPRSRYDDWVLATNIMVECVRRKLGHDVFNAVNSGQIVA